MADDRQELMIEMRIKVKSPRMIASKLAEGVKKIIIKQWPKCSVSIEEIYMISVADATIIYNDTLDDDDDE